MRSILIAGLIAGLAAAIGCGVLPNQKNGPPDTDAAKVASASAPLIAAVDVSHDDKGAPIAIRPVILTADNDTVGFAEPHALSQMTEAHTFVKGAPPEVTFHGGVTTSRVLIGQFSCVPRIQKVRLDTKADDYNKKLIFVADEVACASMTFACDLKAATTSGSQFVHDGHKMVSLERDGFAGRAFVNYNLQSLEGQMIWVPPVPLSRRYFIEGNSPQAVLSQATLVGWKVQGAGSIRGPGFKVEGGFRASGG